MYNKLPSYHKQACLHLVTIVHQERRKSDTNWDTLEVVLDSHIAYNHVNSFWIWYNAITKRDNKD